MHISWNWLSEMVDLSEVGGPQGLADLLTRRGLEVEEIHSLSQGWEKVVTAQILERNPHPQADRLSLCRVTTGQGEPLEIVCGAQNMKAGDKVVLAQIGAHLPNGVKIAQSKIRGVVSNGMLCSEEELGLKEESEGILILPSDAPLGVPLAKYLGRDDTVLVFKLTANRGDCLGHYGMAREVAAALGQVAKRPPAKLLEYTTSPVSIHLDAGELGPQFHGCYIDGVKVGPSPDWVVKRLEVLGSRSINNVVDASNLLMMELGYPTHAYDADRIEGKEIRIRMARENETLKLLDGQTVSLNGTELVIADAKRALGLAGVMGGEDSEVRENTTRIFLECAEFAPELVRRAAARHQRRTEAAQRYEKGVDPLALHYVISRLVQLITEWAGGKVVGAASTVLPSRKPEAVLAKRRIQVAPAYFNRFLGTDLKEAEIEKSLVGLDCLIDKTNGEWLVTAPSYRLDLGCREDLAEEVARTIGYDRIPSTVPCLSSQPLPAGSVPATARWVMLEKVKDALSCTGLMESINFAFASVVWLDKLGFKDENRVRVLNPLSEEHECMVPSLLPGLIRNALDNWRRHFGSEAVSIRLFEVRPTFQLPAGTPIAASSNTETSAVESWKIAFVISGPRFAGGLRKDLEEVDFFDVKAVVERLFQTLGTKGWRLQPLSASRKQDAPQVRLLHPGQSAEILIGNQVAGHIGLLHPGKAMELKTRAPLWIGELDLDVVLKLSRSILQNPTFKQWPEFPLMERDFAILVRNDVTVDRIAQLAVKAGKPLAKVAKVFDIYRGPQVAEGMTSVAVRVIFFDETRSIQESETEGVSARILEAWKKELGAELRG